MKTGNWLIFGAIALLLFAFSASSDVSKKSAPQVQEQYCEVVGVANALSNKTRVVVDYGDGAGFVVINGADGKPMVFKTVIDALNYMNGQGWTLIMPYVVADPGGTTMRYLMKKEK